MRAPRATSLIVISLLLSPLAAIASVPCTPGPHCPMAAGAGGAAPCHGTAIQTDSCCLTAAASEDAMAVPVIAAQPLVGDGGTPAPRAEAAERALPASRPSVAPAPLYRLFRALLI